MGTLHLEDRTDPLKVSPFHLFFSLLIVDSECWVKKCPDSVRWQFQSIPCQRPLKIPNPPTPLLVSVFMLSSVYSHAL